VADGLTASTVFRDEPHLSRRQVHRVTEHERPVKSKVDECGGLHPLRCLSHADVASDCGGWLNSHVSSIRHCSPVLVGYHWNPCPISRLL
jgi:hypothetical protein